MQRQEKWRTEEGTPGHFLGHKLRLLFWLIGFAAGFAWLSTSAAGLPGFALGSIVLFGGVFGLVCGYILSFIGSKIDPRLWRASDGRLKARANALLQKRERQRSLQGVSNRKNQVQHAHV
jgi:hypothetical protein